VKEKIYFEQVTGKYLILETKTGQLNWEVGGENLPKLQIKTLQALLDKNGNNFLVSLCDDIKILVVEPYSKLIQKEVDGHIHIFHINSSLGLLSYEVMNKEFENLNRYGGILICTVIEETNKFVFIMPNMRKFEKKNGTVSQNVVKGNQSSQNPPSNTQGFTITKSEDYIEATVKLPKSLINNNKEEMLELLNKNNAQLKDFYYDMNQKLNYMNNAIKRLVENNEYEYKIKEQEHYIADLNFQLDKLIHDRRLLENERKKAELIAINQLKADLKLSILAIEKHVDIDDVESSKTTIRNLIIEAFTLMEIDNNSIQTVFDNESFNNKFESIADNIDSKIESLIDIRNEFVSKNIINLKGV
jgi:hypothetical protein